MKFDRFMEHCFKILALGTALIVAVGAVVSCTRPLRASAVDISFQEQAGIQDFLDAYAENMSGIDFELNSDSDGNRNVRLQILGKQQLAWSDLFNIYDNMDFSAAPDSISVSGSGSSGLYISALDNQIHAVTLLPPLAEGSYTGCSHTFALSDEFDFTVEYVRASDWANPREFVVNNALYGAYQYGFRSWSNARCYMYGTVSIKPNSYFYGYTTNVDSYYDNVFGCGISDSSDIRVVSRTHSNNPFGTTSTVGYAGTSYELPQGTVDTITPWDYYNDYVLPDIIYNYDIDNIEDYLVFPDGYYPEEPPQPTTSPDYVAPDSTKIVPVIVGIPIPIDVFDDLGELLDVFDILADLLPGGGLQIQIDGVTITFPRDGDSVVINGQEHPLPLPDFQIDGHTINLPDNLHFDFDGVPFTINSDGTITINGDTYNLPIGTPTQVTTDYDNYVYEYDIPTIEKLNIVDAELSSPDLTSYVSGISLVSGAMSDFIDGVGLMSFIVACLSLGAITYVIWKIGG